MNHTHHSSTVARPQNACLAALSPEALALLQPRVSEVVANAGTCLWNAGQPPSAVYFPVNGLISMVVPTDEGQCVEVGCVGQEGAAGIFDHEEANPATRGVVQIGDRFIKIPLSHVLMAARQNDEIDSLLRFCREWLLMQAQQIAACNTLHPADQRLCRWLLQCCRATDSNTLHSTQEQIATLLGIRRTTVTLIAQTLHARGLIEYRRGNIRVEDRDNLELAACECVRNLGEPRWPSKRMSARVPLAAS